MPNKSQIMMNQMQIWLSFSLLSISPLGLAESDTEMPRQSTQVEEVDESAQPLESLKVLQSLKHLNHQASYQTPVVHDLKNRDHVRTLFVETKDLPIIDIQLTFNAGSAQDESIEKGLFGLSNMAAGLIDEGTNQYTANQVASAFEGLGAKFSAKAYRDMFVIRLRVLSRPEKLEPAIAMLLEVVNHSNFKASSINMVLDNTKVGQKQLQENPSRLASIAFYRTLYGQHPYAEPVTGTNGSLRKITDAKLKKFRDTLLVAQNMNIAITGNLSTEEALHLSERLSGQLPQGQKAPLLPEPQDKTDFSILHIPYQSTQAHVTMGHLGLERQNPDVLAIEVANRMFGGGGFNSILNKELRIKRGYTYGATSSFSSTQAQGVFSLSYSTQQDQLMDSIRVAHRAFIDFSTYPLNKTQLEETKAGMLRAFPMLLSSNANINSQLGAMGFYHLSADYLSQYQNKLNALTTDQIEVAVKKYFHPDRLTLVIASQNLDKNALKEMLKQNLKPSPLLSEQHIQKPTPPAQSQRIQQP